MKLHVTMVKTIAQRRYRIQLDFGSLASRKTRSRFPLWQATKQAVCSTAARNTLDTRDSFISRASPNLSALSNIVRWRTAFNHSTAQTTAAQTCPPFHFLGTFDSPAEASCIRDEARVKYRPKNLMLPSSGEKHFSSSSPFATCSSTSVFDVCELTLTLQKNVLRDNDCCSCQ